MRLILRKMCVSGHLANCLLSCINSAAILRSIDTFFPPLLTHLRKIIKLNKKKEAVLYRGLWPRITLRHFSMYYLNFVCCSTPLLSHCSSLTVGEIWIVKNSFAFTEWHCKFHGQSMLVPGQLSKLWLCDCVGLEEWVRENIFAPCS